MNSALPRPQVKPEPRIAPVVVAAIITAATAAAIAAGAALESGFSSPDDRGITLENATRTGFTLKVAASPEHGRWGTTPGYRVEALPSSQVMFNEWKASGQAPPSVASIDDVNDLDSQQQEELAHWIDHDLAEFDANTVEASIVAQGAGVEAIAVYFSDDGQVALACFFQHKPGSGTTYAGATLADQVWMQNAIDGDDDELSKLIDHIKSISSQFTQLSDGASKTVSCGDYTCVFTPGSVGTFKLTQA